MLEKVTEATIDVEGESFRDKTWVVCEEVAKGNGRSAASSSAGDQPLSSLQRPDHSRAAAAMVLVIRSPDARQPVPVRFDGCDAPDRDTLSETVRPPRMRASCSVGRPHGERAAARRVPALTPRHPRARTSQHPLTCLLESPNCSQGETDVAQARTGVSTQSMRAGQRMFPGR
ncbi:MAG: hypothetical protein OEM97_11395 [Acidimicrobiia bacterium]|nr:hypothetical protein [Acidimicrobiia bacterium]